MLEQLRRSSVLEFQHLKAPDHPVPPLRELPEHSVPKPSTRLPHHVGPGSPLAVPDAARESGHVSVPNERPVFAEVEYDGDAAAEDGGVGVSTKAEDVLSPTARG
jgi:glycogenin